VSTRIDTKAASVAVLMLVAVLAFVTSASASEKTAFIPAPFSPFGPEGAGTFSYPTGAAVNEATGEVFVVDGGPVNVVDIFGPEGGDKLASIAGTGVPGGEFDFAHEAAGIAVDNSCYLNKLTGTACTSFDPSNEDLYVSDVEHSVVDKFRRTGPASYVFVCQFNGWYGVGKEACPVGGGSHTEEEKLKEPLGVAVDTQGDVYIASYGESASGTGAIYEFSKEGNGELQIKESEHSMLNAHPKFLGVDSTGDIFVLNYGNERAVTEFIRNSLTGGIVSEKAFLAREAAIAVDPAHNDLYVDGGDEIARYAISNSGEISRDGRFGDKVLTEESQGLAVDGANHNFYISDAGHNDADVFTEKAVPVPEIGGACGTSDITAGSATLLDEVNPVGASGATYAFEYGIEPRELQTGGPIGGAGFMPVHADIGALEPGTVYHCRVSATDTEATEGEIIEEGPEDTFETLPLLPAVEEPAAPATHVTPKGAILNSLVNPGSSQVNPGNDSITEAYFKYGPTEGDYVHTLPSFSVGPGIEPSAVEQEIPVGALEPNSTYHFVLVAHNAAGTVVGPDSTFSTPALTGPSGRGPAAETGLAGGVSLSSATLTGTVDRGGLPTLYKFEFGTTTAYGTVIFGGEAREEQEGVELESVPVGAAVGNLQPGVTYHYRVVAFNADGVSEGADQTFTTAAPPAGTPQPVTLPLLSTPVFMVFKYPPEKPQKHPKHKKKHHKTKPRGKARKSKRK
jgi:DNA-binding beta-propeller fold protein YncE